MKRNFTLSKNDKSYVLKDTNPKRNEEPFVIDIEELKFNTADFYDYVFSGITVDHEIKIKNSLGKDDKMGEIVYNTIDEIIQGVMAKLKGTEG